MAIETHDQSEIDWSRLSEQLRRYLRVRVGVSLSDADIDELSQECLVHLLDPSTKPWRPDVASLFVFACGVAWGLLRNRLRLEGRRRRHTAALMAEETAEPADANFPEVFLDHRRALALLRESLATDADASALVELMLEGRDRYPDYRALGFTRTRYENAKRRLARQLLRLGRELRGDGPKS